ncbi:MAG: OmpA family protein [Granulosicoccus sp.]|nr:OmpA family protein [Granulosicoccus sp.]
MKSLKVTLVAATTTLLLVSGCATDDPNRRTKTGAAIGAIAGGVIGHQADSKNGRYAGAVVGALTGAAVGNYMDRQQRKLEERLAVERRNKQIEVTRIDEETLKLNLRSEASFDVNSDQLNAGFRDSLKTMAEVIGEYDKTAVHIIGHTDSTGTQSYNQALSEKRATTVTRYLSRNGVERSRMRFSGRGESSPLDSNATSSGRSRNRRVEVYLKSVVEGRENEAFRSPV